MATRSTKKKSHAGYMISAVADLYKLHPQTLRLYERAGDPDPKLAGQHARRWYASAARPARGPIPLGEYVAWESRLNHRA